MIHSRIIWGFMVAVVMLATAKLAAQDPFDLDEIRVVAPYEPTISDAFKIPLNPRIEDTLDIRMHFTYNIPRIKALTSFELEPIAPARMRGEPLTRLYRGFVKGGYGSYSSPYFEGFYNTLRSNNTSLGIHLKHLSSGGGIPDVGYNAYSDNHAMIYGQKFFQRNTLGAQVSYDRNVVHYYGFKREDYEEDPFMLDTIDAISNSDLRQQFDALGARLYFESNQSDSSRLGHKNALHYQWLQDHYEASEHQIGYRGRLGRNIEADPFGMADKQYFNIDLLADYLNTTNQLDTSNTFLIGLQPRLWSTYNAFRFHIGVNAAFQVDSVSYFRAYPLLGAELEIVPSRLMAFVSFSGSTEKHSMSSLRSENPFINTSIPYAFMNMKSDASGGLKGAIGDIIGYSLSLNHSVIENHPFFVNDTTAILNNRFSLVYDDIRKISIRANLTTQFGERFYARITGNYSQYRMNNELEAWHTPASTISAHLRYNIQDKIILTSDIFTRSETYGRAYDELGQTYARITHPFHADVNLGIEYRYTKRMAVFLNFSNVGNQSLERWMNYPSQGFNFLGGASFSF